MGGSDPPSACSPGDVQPSIGSTMCKSCLGAQLAPGAGGMECESMKTGHYGAVQTRVELGFVNQVYLDGSRVLNDLNDLLHELAPDYTTSILGSFDMGNSKRYDIE